MVSIFACTCFVKADCVRRKIACSLTEIVRSAAESLSTVRLNVMEVRQLTPVSAEEAPPFKKKTNKTKTKTT